MSYYGTTVVFSNFIAKSRFDKQGNWATTPSGAALNPKDADAQPGALGMGKEKAQAITLFNHFYIYVCPLLGAWIADTYLGRFKTIVCSVIIAEIGHALLTSSAAPSILDKPKNAFALFIIGILVMGLGTGTFKPNISPLIAEQIPMDAPRVKVNKKGERGSTRRTEKGFFFHDMLTLPRSTCYRGSSRDCLSDLQLVLHVHQHRSFSRTIVYGSSGPAIIGGIRSHLSRRCTPSVMSDSGSHS